MGAPQPNSTSYDRRHSIVRWDLELNFGKTQKNVYSLTFLLGIVRGASPFAVADEEHDFFVEESDGAMLYVDVDGFMELFLLFMYYYVVSDLERLSLVPPAHAATAAEPNPTAENNEWNDAGCIS